MFKLERNYINQDKTRVLLLLLTTYIYFAVSILHYVINSCLPLIATSSLVCSFTYYVTVQGQTVTDAAIEKNKHVTIVTFLLELDTYTRVNNCSAFTDNTFGKNERR